MYNHMFNCLMLHISHRTLSQKHLHSSYSNILVPRAARNNSSGSKACTSTDSSNHSSRSSDDAITAVETATTAAVADGRRSSAVTKRSSDSSSSRVAAAGLHVVTAIPNTKTATTSNSNSSSCVSDLTATNSTSHSSSAKYGVASPSLSGHGVNGAVANSERSTVNAKYSPPSSPAFGASPAYVITSGIASSSKRIFHSGPVQVCNCLHSVAVIIVTS
jgi:hypothetical protein